MRRALPALAWLLGLAGLALALGLQTVPPGHVAARTASGAPEPDAFGPGLHPSLRLWHQWTLSPATETRLYGRGGRPALPLGADGRARLSLAVQLSLSQPLPTQPDPVAAAVAALPSPGADDAALTRALDAALAAHPAIAAARTTLLDRGEPSPPPSPALVARLTAAEAAVRAAREAAEAAAAAAARATERAEAAAALDAARLTAEADRALADLEAETRRATHSERATGDATYARLIAEGELVEARARAEIDALTAAALAGPGGRWLLAVEAARRYRLPARLPLDLEQLHTRASLAAWKTWFLQGLSDPRPARAQPATP